MKDDPTEVIGWAVWYACVGGMPQLEFGLWIYPTRSAAVAAFGGMYVNEDDSIEEALPRHGAEVVRVRIERVD